MRRLNFDVVETLPAVILIEDIVNLIPGRYKNPVNKRFASGGLLTEKSFEAVTEAVRQLSPKSSTLIERYSAVRIERINALSTRVKTNLAYQKEAVLTALAIADIKRDIIQQWTPSDDKPLSFLSGLPNARLLEDQMIINDMMKVPGFSLIKDSINVTGSAVFQSDVARLTVILANRLPLEEQNGTDLIYYNETFHSFVMVQYKAMESEPDNKGNSQAVFRIPNQNLPQQIERMEALLELLQRCEGNTEIHGFRLTENPFFIKLCPRIVFNPDNIGLVPGMYLPLAYWKILEQSPNIKGPLQGKRVTFDNVGRYFDNTAFASIVAKAWVGTTPSQSGVLREAIRETLQSGTAIALAIKSRIEHPNEDDEFAELADPLSD